MVEIDERPQTVYDNVLRLEGILVLTKPPIKIDLLFPQILKKKEDDTKFKKFL